MPYLTFNFYPTVMVEKNGDAFCDHTTFAGYLVALGHGLNMTQTMLIVYRENCFSVDLNENPMFAGVKQGSFGNELAVELSLRAHVDLAGVESAIDHHRPADLAQAQLRGIGQYFDHYRRVGAVVVIHGQEV